MQNSKTVYNIPVSRVIEVGKTYKHYSGKLYKVLAIAHDSEDTAMLHVVYQALYNCPINNPF